MPSTSEHPGHYSLNLRVTDVSFLSQPDEVARCSFFPGAPLCDTRVGDQWFGHFTLLDDSILSGPDGPLFDPLPIAHFNLFSPTLISFCNNSTFNPGAWNSRQRLGRGWLQALRSFPFTLCCSPRPRDRGVRCGFRGTGEWKAEVETEHLNWIVEHRSYRRLLAQYVQIRRVSEPPTLVLMLTATGLLIRLWKTARRCARSQKVTEAGMPPR